MTALLNGEPWSAAAAAGLYGTNELDIAASNVDSLSYWREWMSLAVPFEGEGAYPLYRDSLPEGGRAGQYASYSEMNADAIFADYRLLDEAANRLTVTTYDSVRGVVEGTFEATLIVDPDDRKPPPELAGDYPERQRPDTLRFTEGRFRIGQVDDRRTGR